MMASDIRVSGASVQREVPALPVPVVLRRAAPTRGDSTTRTRVSADGQRFLIPQFETVHGLSAVAARRLRERRCRHRPLV